MTKRQVHRFSTLMKMDCSGYSLDGKAATFRKCVIHNRDDDDDTNAQTTNYPSAPSNGPNSNATAARNVSTNNDRSSANSEDTSHMEETMADTEELKQDMNNDFDEVSRVLNQKRAESFEMMQSQNQQAQHQVQAQINALMQMAQQMAASSGFRNGTPEQDQNKTVLIQDTTSNIRSIYV